MESKTVMTQPKVFLGVGIWLLCMLFILRHDFWLTTRETLVRQLSCAEKEEEEQKPLWTEANFTYLVEPLSCNLPHQDLAIIFVLSMPKQHQIRTLVRNSWAAILRRYGHKIVFVVGIAPFMNKSQLLFENQQNDDVLLVQLNESYDMLIVKVYSMLAWAHKHCNGATWLAKVDIDTFINPFKLMETFTVYAHIKDKPIFGKCLTDEPPRMPGAKWYVPLAVFPDPIFPTRCEGPTYVLPFARLASMLKQISLTGFPLTLEDVYYTGIIAESLNIKRQNRHGFYTGLKDCTCALHKTSIHMHNARENLTERLTDCWDRLRFCRKDANGCPSEARFDCSKRLLRYAENFSFMSTNYSVTTPQNISAFFPSKG